MLNFLKFLDYRSHVKNAKAYNFHKSTLLPPVGSSAVKVENYIGRILRQRI